MLKHLFLKISVLLFFTLLISMTTRCDSGLNGQLEYADYLLDKGNFEDAITLLNILDTEYPDNIEVKTKLASAYLAHGSLGDGKTYLSLVADYFEPTPSGKTDFQAFSEKSPNLSDDQIVEIAHAREIFDEQIPDAQKTKGVWLQLGFARLFELNAIGVVKTGALSPDLHCNSDVLQGPDGIPDDFNPSALTPDEAAQFDEDAAQVADDFINAGLADDSGVVQKVQNIATTLATFTTLADYLNNQFGLIPGFCP